jgi:hypothetical protein
MRIKGKKVQKKCGKTKKERKCGKKIWLTSETGVKMRLSFAKKCSLN